MGNKFKVGDRVICYNYDRFLANVSDIQDDKVFVQMVGSPNNGAWVHYKQCKQCRKLVKKMDKGVLHDFDHLSKLETKIRICEFNNKEELQNIGFIRFENLAKMIAAAIRAGRV